MACYRFVADDWTFFAEGGAHIVLVANNVSTLSPFHGMILRIAKLPISSPTEKTITNNHDEEKRRLMFIQNSMQLWFDPNKIVSSSMVLLPTEFTTAILLKIDSARPIGRKKAPIALDTIAFLERNLFRLSCGSSINKCSFPATTSMNACPSPFSVDIAVEIKVKCGLKSISPFLFVDQDCVIKRQMSRFQLMQHYKLATTQASNQQEVVWGTFQQESSYNPCDLCSQDTLRINQAVNTLLSNPQNNLRILVNGNHIFGWDRSCELQDLQKSLLESTAQCITVDDFKSALSTIIASESLFYQLESLQALDIFDSEGAKILYDHGLSILDGDYRQFHEKLQFYFSSPCQNIGDYIQLASDRLYPFLIDENDCYENLLQKFNGAMAVVKSLTLEEVLQWLRIWMIAYVAKDASIIVAMNFASNSFDEDSIVGVYESHLIDVGCKPVSKIVKRADQDKQICRLVGKFLSESCSR